MTLRKLIKLLLYRYTCHRCSMALLLGLPTNLKLVTVRLEALAESSRKSKLLLFKLRLTDNVSLSWKATKMVK